MKKEKVKFQSENLTLEGIISTKKDNTPSSGVIVCHPHPLYGGNMDNNVVTAICEGLNRVGISSLRFNFRGVQKSEGKYSKGVGEQADVNAAISFLISKIAAKKIGVCGYSFGSLVGIPAAVKNKNVHAIASISPPYFSPPKVLAGYYGSKLIVCGSEDKFVKLTELESLMKTLPEPKKFIIVHGVDHFWRNHENKLSELVTSFFSESLK